MDVCMVLPIRFFIVLAALLVKVTARMRDRGVAKAVCSHAMRHTSVSVLPLPAPAIIS